MPPPAPLAPLAPTPSLSLVLCVENADHGALRSRLARLHDALAVDHEIVLVGAGDPDRLAPLLRQLAAADPRHRVLLHTRRCSSAEALVAAVSHACAAWVAALADAGTPQEGATIAELVRHACTPAAPACLHAGPDQPVLFARSAFLALAPIAQMRAYLPELFARAGAEVRDLGAAQRRSRAAVPLLPWLRRARVALLCRMAAFGSIARA